MTLLATKTLLASTIPGSSNNGYVAAAYIVFFAIVLIYVAIMAVRLTRVERSLHELNDREQAPEPEELRRSEPGRDERGETLDQARERETV